MGIIIPCEKCPVFIMCKGRVQAEGISKLVVIGLACSCDMLYNFISEDKTKTFLFTADNVNTIRYFFGWDGTHDYPPERMWR